ncbi:MAG: hypothetical protein ACD_75C01148G0005, partial [uncultured bacterium]
MRGSDKREMIGNEGMVILDMVRRLNRRAAIDHLRKLIDKTHPADMAWVYRHLTEDERTAVFNIIVKTDSVGEFLSELDVSHLTELVKGLTPQSLAEILATMPSDDAVDILEALPP